MSGEERLSLGFQLFRRHGAELERGGAIDTSQREFTESGDVLAFLYRTIGV